MISQRFTVIIVNYNGVDFLVPALDSLIESGINVHQIILVDNGSSDHSTTLINNKYPEATLIRNGCNAGFAAAVNRGLRLVQTEFSLLFNNDALIDSRALSELGSVFDEQPKAAILGARLINLDGSTQNSIAPYPTLFNEVIKHKKLKNSRYNSPTKVESVIGACLAVRMSSLKKTGFLDETFFFFLEETELCWRAAQLGYEIYYVPGAIATHFQGGTANKFRTEARIEFQRSKLIYYKKVGGTNAWIAASFILTAKSLINFLSNFMVFILSLGSSKSYRVKSTGYLKILLWHLLFRPSSWGLPNKCGKSEISQ
jgi:N-acetylglucosaminyl-diphospho-decaprenol L-rhamnosyltransferase